MTWAIGVDIGGTKVALAHVDLTGKVCNRIHFDTHKERGYEEIEKDIVKASHELAKQASTPPIGIGLGMAGQIEAKNGLVYFAPNLDWHNIPLKSDLENFLNIPAYVINDVRASTLGELRYGAGRNCQDFVCMFVGTGVGGGLVSGGKILTGDNNSAGEIGHMTINFKQGRKCTCGNYGCLEAYAGGWAIAEQAKEKIKDNQQTSKYLLDLAGGSIDKITAKHVAMAANKGDTLCCEVINTAVEALIAGSASITNMLNPQKLIFGGGIIEGIPELIDLIRKGVFKRALKSACQNLEVLHAHLGNDSGIIGAASLALKKE